MCVCSIFNNINLNSRILEYYICDNCDQFISYIKTILLECLYKHRI